MIRDVIYWTTIAILWGCIALNWWGILQNRRIKKRLKHDLKYLEVQTKAFEEFLKTKHAEMEETSDARNDQT